MSDQQQDLAVHMPDLQVGSVSDHGCLVFLFLMWFGWQSPSLLCWQLLMGQLHGSKLEGEKFLREGAMTHICA